MSFQQIALTHKSNSEFNLDFPVSCFFVIVGGKYLNMIGNVMEKVNNVTNDIGRAQPLAVFLFNDNYKENVDIDVNYGFVRYKSAPVMV